VSKGQKLSPKEIAGIVIGSVFGFIAIVTIGCCVIVRRRRARLYSPINK